MFRHYKSICQKKLREIWKYTELIENENMTYQTSKSTVCERKCILIEIKKCNYTYKRTDKETMKGQFTQK